MVIASNQNINCIAYYIDDIRVYNRILTDNGVSVGQKAGLEVLNNYNKTKGNYDQLYKIASFVFSNEFK